MIVFPRSVYKDIKSGKMTLAFRLWPQCRVSSGKSYKLENLGRILVRGAEKISLSSITDQDARRAGFKNADLVISHFQNKKPDLNPHKDSCFRIEFKYLGHGDKRKNDRLSHHLNSQNLEKIDQRVQKLDRRAQGVTYSAILKQMAGRPYMNVKKLARHFECNFSEIRRKLYRLMDERLIEMDARKCFQLTSRGRQLVEHKQAKLSEIKK